MAKEKLTAMRVAKEMRPGLHNDGGGLYLRVSDAGTKSWAFRYMLDGKRREAGLGALNAIGLAEAREKATEYRRDCAIGVDPIEQRHEQKTQKRLEVARAVTFEHCAERYIAANQDTWRNEKHRAQWSSTLKTYVYPVFGDLPVQAIDATLVIKVLEPIWTTKLETAGRVRQRIEAILDWAKVRKFRNGENPARWDGHLEHALPAPKDIRKRRPVKHHTALPFSDVPEFMAQLGTRDGVAARALEFAILTAARTSEVIGAVWSEIDLTAKVWTIPAARMKAGEEHRVPLSARAVELLGDLSRESDFVFPSGRQGVALSNMAMDAVLKRMGYKDGRATVHGFRSTFRDWVSERTAFQNHVAEKALAHVVGDKVEAAYRRGDLFDKRRKLMEAWAGYCTKPAAGGTVVQLRAS